MKMTSSVKESREKETKKPVINFMGGTSYEISPLETLKMVSASSIFGEPSYYRNGEFAEKKIKDGKYKSHVNTKDYILSVMNKYEGAKTSEIMENAIDEALDYDFKGTLDWAITLRTEYFMRLNPQIIMVRAAHHPKRKTFTAENQGYFNKTQMSVMTRGDDVIAQLTYQLYRYGGKKAIPSVLKRSWANRVNSLSRYELYKYKNHGIGLINTIRICHANNKDINELMRTGTLAMPESNMTWETLRTNGDSWLTILDKIDMPHMALLRNLRGIFKEINSTTVCKNTLEHLKKGVKRGKQFPFRYYSAYNAVKKEVAVNHKAMIEDSLEECVDIAMENLPKLSGKSAFLSDNSGSAWGTFNSEYGSTTIALIDNLSAVIGAYNSEEGYVFPFGDRLEKVEISKRNGVMSQCWNVNNIGKKVGKSTECGVWLFFDDIIKNKEHYDNIFIYSDMQAGHGELYGTEYESKRYKKDFGIQSSWSALHIDVMKLIEKYRQEVNPKVNVYCVQTAGYDNVLVPEYAYRCNILYGWTGKELLFAKAMNDFWDEHDNKKINNQGVQANG